jgi:hypothetical protein
VAQVVEHFGSEFIGVVRTVLLRGQDPFPQQERSGGTDHGRPVASDRRPTARPNTVHRESASPRWFLFPGEIRMPLPGRHSRYFANRVRAHEIPELTTTGQSRSNRRPSRRGADLVRRALESGLPAWLRRPGTHQPGQCSHGAASRRGKCSARVAERDSHRRADVLKVTSSPCRSHRRSCRWGRPSRAWQRARRPWRPLTGAAFRGRGSYRWRCSPGTPS